LAAFALGSSHPAVHEQIVRFKLAIDAASASIPEKTAEVIKTEFTLFPESITPSAFNEEFLSKQNDSARHVFAALRVRQLLPSHEKSKSESEILRSLGLPDITLAEAIEGLELLSSWKSSTESYVSKANSLWPEATVFKEEKSL
jgi:N-alpha-acetyltransferase 15/16, NatA auxiliary subunit